MNADLTRTVESIDTLIRQQSWFDLHIYSYKNGQLIVAGSIDLTYSHTLEIIFDDVYFFSGYPEGWHSDTDKTVFEIPDQCAKLYKQFQIIQEYTLFRFAAEDTPDVLIAASAISYNTDTVYYYNRPDLKENERIADFVKLDNPV
jgi:hypothetical protein